MNRMIDLMALWRQEHRCRMFRFLSLDEKLFIDEGSAWGHSEMQGCFILSPSADAFRMHGRNTLDGTKQQFPLEPVNAVNTCCSSTFDHSISVADLVMFSLRTSCPFRIWNCNPELLPLRHKHFNSCALRYRNGVSASIHPATVAKYPKHSLLCPADDFLMT